MGYVVESLVGGTHMPSPSPPGMVRRTAVCHLESESVLISPGVKCNTVGLGSARRVSPPSLCESTHQSTDTCTANIAGKDKVIPDRYVGKLTSFFSDRFEGTPDVCVRMLVSTSHSHMLLPCHPKHL